MLDIIFISYDEPNADKNWKNLKARFPYAKRVHGVKGIANAHMAACKKANTQFFYVVDADAEILDSFKFDYKPPEYDSEYVHIWHALNPATGQDYGYGGVKLFNKKHFRNVKNALDFSTTLTKDVKIIDKIACITRFNSDAVRAFRGAFRESVKLYTIINDESKPENQRIEARNRLDRWLNPVQDCDYQEIIALGARDGIEQAKQRGDDLSFINDHDLMFRMLMTAHPEIDPNIEPQLNENHPMKHEFFFTTRIAGVLYDKFIEENLSLNELRDALSDGQMYSKTWLVEELSKLIESGKIEKKEKYHVVVLGGWIGLLSLMLFTWEFPVSVISIDIDHRANMIAEKMNWGFDFKAVHNDMYNTNYAEFDIIINTSSEHIPDIPAWRATIPSKKIVIVQNTDYEDGDGHVSIVSSSNQLRNKLNLSEVLYEGTRKFNQYNRFMIIGRT